ncbi:MAG: hypothetical protein V1709_11690 [Planctomycetota bacterium]
MYITRNTTRQKVLLEQDKRIFRTSDLAVLWQISNKNTLLTTIKRYVKNQIFYRLAVGIYATVPLTRLHPYEIGCAIAGPLSYISTESILAGEGIIMQQPMKITLIGKKSLEFEIAGHQYICRYLNPKYLVNRLGIVDNGRFCTALSSRAVADTRHFNSRYYFDNQKTIDLNLFNQIYLKEI